MSLPSSAGVKEDKMSATSVSTLRQGRWAQCGHRGTTFEHPGDVCSITRP